MTDPSQSPLVKVETFWAKTFGSTRNQIIAAIVAAVVVIIFFLR